MKMTIIGGGQVGKNLAQILLERQHTVHLIEQSRLRCERLANELDAEVHRGDGTDVNVLKAAGAADSAVVMAVTGVDQDNLVAAQIAKNHFRAKKVIVRVNDPRNIETFRVLGITNSVSSTEVITRMIEQEADLPHMHLLTSLNKGKANICSIVLNDKSRLINRMLMDIRFPSGTLIISIIREEKLIIPNGSTIFYPGDEIIAVAEDHSQKAFMKLLSTVR